MKEEVTLEYLQEYYPEILTMAEERLANSRSREKTKTLADMTFHLRACAKPVAFAATSFSDVLDSIRDNSKHVSKVPQELTLDEEVAEKLDSICWFFEASINRWYVRLDPTPDMTRPPQVEATYRQAVIERREEEARYASLSEEEQLAEIQELLGEMQGMPGFIAMAMRNSDED